MAHSKKELLEKLIKFKAERGHLPTRQDFSDKKITPSHITFYRIFKNAKNIEKQVDLYERGELIFEDERKEEPTPNKATRRVTKFRCPFCGSNIQEPFVWANCKTYIIMRLVELIKNNSSNGDYTNGVFDCLARIFGAGQRNVEFALRSEGFFEAFSRRIEFDERFNVQKQNLVVPQSGKSECHVCRKYKDDVDMTIDCVSPCGHEDICEDCLAKKEINKKEYVKNNGPDSKLT